MNNVTPATTQTVLAARDLVRSFTDGAGSPVPVLNGVSFDIPRGELVAVVGSSGSGKSTLLQILGGLDACDGGSVSIDGQNLQKLSEREICTLRNEKLGFVYQFHHLLPEFTALENVAMPLVIARIPDKEAHERARAALEALGLGHRLTHLPSQLSGGERQRTAIARAMVNDPALLLAAEPTGALDSETSRVVMDLFHEMHEKYHKTIVLITHNPALAEECQRVLTLHDGRIIAERKGSGVRGAL